MADLSPDSGRYARQSQIDLASSGAFTTLSPLNKSVSKQMYSFPKASRFSP